MAKKIFRSVFLASLLVLLLSFLIIAERICSFAESVKNGTASGAPYGIIMQCLAAFAFAILVSVFLAGFMSKKIVDPLRRIDPDHPLDAPELSEYPEIYPLLSRLQSQKDQLLRKDESLDRKQRELAVILGNMKEGMILLDKDLRVISMNNAADSILDIHRHFSEQSILKMDIGDDLKALIQKAQSGLSREESLSFHSKNYEVIASPVVGGAGSQTQAPYRPHMTGTSQTIGNEDPHAGLAAEEVIGVTVVLIEERPAKA